MGKAPTIYDVSKAAGVSTATISRFLNTPEKVNPATRDNVEKVIKELGYRPLLEARLRTTKEGTRICVCAPRFTENSFVQRLRGITVALSSPEYELQVYSVESKAQMDRFIDSMELGGPDGLIALSLPFTDEQIQKITRCGVELVMIEHASQLANCVVINDILGGRLAAEHLIAKGRKKFGFAGEMTEADFSIYPIADRMRGYRTALQKSGLKLNPKYIYDIRCDTDYAYQEFLTVFKSDDYPDAIFTSADVMALGILRAARESGLRVPEDVSIIGFDDIDFADYVGLTTIRQNLDQSGQVAVELLINRMKEPGRLNQMIQLPLELVERTTT